MKSRTRNIPEVLKEGNHSEPEGGFEASCSLISAAAQSVIGGKPFNCSFQGPGCALRTDINGDVIIRNVQLPLNQNSISCMLAQRAPKP
jgi:hypothetical protein